MSNLIQQSQPPQVIVDQIISLYNEGQLERTVSLAESLAEQYPNALILYDILGAAYVGLKNTDKTIESYQNALRLNPNNTDAYNNMGMALYDQGKFNEAVESYTKAVELEPKFADAHYNLGNALKQIGELKKAIASYRVSLAINPNDAEVLLNYGNALKDYGPFDRTIEAFKNALKSDPSSSVVQANLDNAIKEKVEMDKNIADYAQIAKLEISSAEMFSFTGAVLKNKGYLEAAIDSYKQALKINPDYADAYYNMGLALSEKGELGAAIDNYKQVLKIKPDYAEAYYNMGFVLNEKGELDAATDSYKQAIKIKPDYAEAKHLVAALTGETTNSAPREYIEKLFDDYATNFENSLVEKLEYEAPRIIAKMIIKRHSNKALGSVLDLGCGTGLLGLELKQFCHNLKGIDLSNLMLEKAKAKDVYDQLIHGDIVEYLADADLDFNYFVSTDVFIYVGELSDVFRLIKSRNNRQGKLVFSTEHTERQGFHLEKSGRYSHSRTYIESLCSKYDYQLSHFEKIKLRKDKGEFLTGGLYLLDF